MRARGDGWSRERWDCSKIIWLIAGFGGRWVLLSVGRLVDGGWWNEVGSDLREGKLLCTRSWRHLHPSSSHL